MPSIRAANGCPQPHLRRLSNAQSVVQSFEHFIRENKNEISALRILYSRPYRQRLALKQIDELAKAIERPPRLDHRLPLRLCPGAAVLAHIAQYCQRE